MIQSLAKHSKIFTELEKTIPKAFMSHWEKAGSTTLLGFPLCLKSTKAISDGWERRPLAELPAGLGGGSWNAAIVSHPPCWSRLFRDAHAFDSVIH